MMGKLIVVMSVGLLLGAAESRPPITVTGSGWSQAPQRWTIEADGSITDTRGAGFAGVLPFKVVTRHTGPVAGRYDEVARTLAPARAWAGRTLPCKSQITDATFGSVHWGRASLNFYTGCGDAKARPALTAISAAWRKITGWIDGAPVVRERMITTPEEVNNP